MTKRPKGGMLVGRNFRLKRTPQHATCCRTDHVSPDRNCSRLTRWHQLVYAPLPVDAGQRLPADSSRGVVSGAAIHGDWAASRPSRLGSLHDLFFSQVPCWISQTSRVVEYIGVAVEGLRVGGVGDEGVGAGEAAQVGQVVAGVHVDEAQVVGCGQVVVAVAGVAQAGDGLRRLSAPVAEGEVARDAVALRAAGPGFAQHAGAAQVVAVAVEEAVVGAHRVAGDALDRRLLAEEIGQARDGGGHLGG